MSIGIAVFLGVMALAAGLRLWQLAAVARDALLYPPRLPVTESPADFGLETWESVSLTAADGISIAGWYIPPGESGAALVMVHGFSANRTKMLAETAVLIQHGYGALLIDLRNHGKSGGDVTTWGNEEWLDVQAGVNDLLTRSEINPDKIGLMGKSMGSAAMVIAASRLPEIKAVVAMSTYAGFPDNLPSLTMRIGGRPDWLSPLVLQQMAWKTERPVAEVRPVAEIANYEGAILFMHGANDLLVAPQHSQELFAAANEPKFLYVAADAEHIDIMASDPAEFERQLITFLDSYLKGEP